MIGMLRLNPPLFVVTPKGDGCAVVMTDYGPETNPVFLVILDDSREVISVDQCDIRGGGNAMWNLQHPDAPESKA